MNSLLFDKGLAQTTPFPVGLDVSHAKGSYIYTRDGKKYLDMISGLSVSNLGHGSESVKKAIMDQLEKHSHVMVYGEYEQKSTSDLAKTLTSLLPETLNTCYFLNSGTEANEAAIKLCRRFTGRSEIISFNGAYHGGTTGSLAISSSETKKAAFRPLMSGVNFIELNNEKDLLRITTNTACVFLETIQGDAGIRIPDLTFMKALRARCTEVGALLVLDEIQAGMGRTGKFSAFEHYAVIPDIICLGKALGAGLPIGALVTSREIMTSLISDPMLGHITTFGGNPVICAAANAGLKELIDSNVLKDVEEKGNLIFEELKRCNAVKEIRHKGLFIAVELHSAEAVQQAFDYCLENGVITFWFLSCPHAFRLAPPLNISDEDLAVGIRVIKEALLSLEGFEVDKIIG